VRPTPSRVHISTLTVTPFRSKHCEGRITRFLFGLLFHDILFHPSVPGAFETPYQTAPLDLVHDTFYSSRKAVIDARLEELISPGRALEIVALRDEQLRGDNVFFVGGRWDAFEREEIMEIVEVSCGSSGMLIMN
jgi:fanconi-associated nuclease 1